MRQSRHRRRTNDQSRTLAMSKERELWAVALWVEKNHGDQGDLYIARRLDRLHTKGDADGVAMWWKVLERFEALSQAMHPPS